ncbi:polymerase/histidinol phosphatase [Macleaya cordata]|uniref:Polymerase/histidinol phosphatase n=1 Tax=Macleaya cordata TaxID=56857 RepID=A0A200PY48_MACCD|nr:polymerase/histidinol phosphatase [Macleaya cordata]
MGDRYSVQNNGCSNVNGNGNGNGGNSKNKKKAKKKKKSNGKKKKMTVEQNLAAKSVGEWVFFDSSFSTSSTASSVDDFGVQRNYGGGRAADKVVFELHSHSICSDGYLSPTALIERAHRNGVKVLALTDHDTMCGIPEALEAARKFGIRIIPGVEISTIFTPRGESGNEEPVHILAYYGICGPSRYEELEKCLANIREGRYIRAQNMLLKLNNLKMPLKWEHVAKIAGNGVAPGRLHVARAMVEAGHVENLKQAFSRYLYDGGPAYSTGNELLAEEAVKLICRTGGVAALAHPWALKNPVGVIRRLKDAGLHAIEVYRSDGKLAAFSDLADTYHLVKLGGSDYHGRGNHDESDLGSVNLPVLAVHEFLKLARPIWCEAIKDILQSFAEEPSDSNLEKLTRFGRMKNLKGALSCGQNVVDLCLSSWLTSEERQSVEFEALRLKLSHTVIDQNGVILPSVMSR